MSLSLCTRWKKDAFFSPIFVDRLGSVARIDVCVRVCVYEEGGPQGGLCCRRRRAPVFCGLVSPPPFSRLAAAHFGACLVWGSRPAARGVDAIMKRTRGQEEKKLNKKTSKSLDDWRDEPSRCCADCVSIFACVTPGLVALSLDLVRHISGKERITKKQISLFSMFFLLA